MRHLFILLLLVSSLFGADYDCVFIGSSPISLFEALYQHGSGKKVLIIDDAPFCGGVWKSIEMCGVAHVDIGCHEIGNNPSLKEFLEIYGGCQMVSTDKNNFYFSNGCYELIHNLEKRLEKTSVDLRLNTRATRAHIDEENQCVFLQVGMNIISTEKVYMCGYSFLTIGNESEKPIHKTKHFHLYLLIADPTSSRFSYQTGGIPNISRMMNLTRFVGLEQTGRQLIVFQTNESYLDREEEFLSDLKKQKLIDPSAYILKTEPYIYEQWPSNSFGKYQPYIETLHTHDFRSMSHYFAKWKEVLKPYAEINQ